MKLKGESQIIDSKITGLAVEDWRDNAEWKLQVSASPLIADESNELMMELSPISKILSAKETQVQATITKHLSSLIEIKLN